jgi:hypothetical protein
VFVRPRSTRVFSSTGQTPEVTAEPGVT